MPTVNQRVSEYVLEDKIGGGTFGEVWRAHHHVWTDQLVAIKIPTDPQYVRNLQREGAAVHGLVHTNIVRAIGFDPYADPPYLTMEYIPGSSLRGVMQQRKAMPPNDVVAIMKQVLAGLGFAHDHGVVHRDVKPENILIHERAAQDGFAAEGVVKVTDFGLGRAATTTMGSIAYSASLNNPEGREIAGTLDYMAPEQRSGADVDARADLYACGVMFYEMLTGERPAGTELPSEINRAVPKHLDDVFRRSYARLDKRYASAAEFLKALTIGGPPPVPTRPVSGAPSAPPPLRTGPVAPPPVPQQFNAGQSAHSAAFYESTAKAACPKCRQPIDRADQFCMHCGVQLKAVRRCKCGAYPEANDRYCIFCGEVLAQEMAV